MPIFPLQNVGSIDGAATVANTANKFQRNALLGLDQQITKRNIAEFDANAGTREDARNRASIKEGAIGAMPFVLANDDEGLKRYFRGRIATVQARNGDATGSIRGLEHLESGDPQRVAQAKRIITQIAGVGQAKRDTKVVGDSLIDTQTGDPIFTAPPDPLARILSAQEVSAIPTLDPSGTYQQKPDGSISLVSQPPRVGGGTVGVRERKINDALRLNPGLSEQQATKIVDGQARLEFNEKTGRLVFFDNVAGTAEEVQVGSGQPLPPEPTQGKTLYELAAVATGPVAGASGAVEQVRAFGGGAAGPVTEAQQRFKTVTQDMVRALSINPRFPKGEMDIIREEIDIQPSFFRGVDVLRAKMRSIDSALRVRMLQAERDANDTTLDDETRQKQGANASSIRNFLAQLGVPPVDAGEIESRKQQILNRLEQLRAQ